MSRACGLMTPDGAEGVLLHEHSHLIWLLARCDRVVNGAMEPLEFCEKPMRLELILEQNAAEQIQGRLGLLDEDGAKTAMEQPQMLDESHLLSDTTIYSIQPLGMAFQNIRLFEDSIPAGQLNECLTLLFSSFSNVEVSFQKYTRFEDTPLAARAALVFQQVDENAALHLEVTQAVPGFSLDFARDYDLVRVAFIDEMENLIRVREVHYGDVLAARSSLLKRLKKISRSVKSAEAYLVDDEEGLVLGPDLASEFLRKHLAEIVSEFELYGAEKLKSYRIKHVQPKLNVKLGHGIDFLEGDAALELDGERFFAFRGPTAIPQTKVYCPRATAPTPYSTKTTWTGWRVSSKNKRKAYGSPSSTSR